MFSGLLTLGNGLKLAVVLAVLGAIWYTLDSWHFSKVRDLKRCEIDQVAIVKFHDNEIKIKDINISNLQTDLKACSTDTKNAFSDGYYRGLSDASKDTVTVYSHYSF